MEKAILTSRSWYDRTWVAPLGSILLAAFAGLVLRPALEARGVLTPQANILCTFPSTGEYSFQQSDVSGKVEGQNNDQWELLCSSSATELACPLSLQIKDGSVVTFNVIAQYVSQTGGTHMARYACDEAGAEIREFGNCRVEGEVSPLRKVRNQSGGCNYEFTLYHN